MRLAGLHAINDVLNDPKIKFKDAKDVRWLSHTNAIKAMVRRLPSLLISLNKEAAERGDPTANGLLKFGKSKDIQFCCLYTSPCRYSPSPQQTLITFSKPMC